MSATAAGSLAETFYHFAVAHHRAGRVGDAAAAYERALALEPRFAQAYSGLGVLQYEAGDAGAAAGLQRRALEIDPANPGIQNNLGLALEAQGRPDEALATFDRALALAPHFVEAWSNRGVVLHALGRLADALASFDRAISIDAGDAQAWSNRGLVLAQMLRHDEALASVEQASSLQPGYAEAWANRGAICNELQRYDAALAAFGKAVAIDPRLDEVLGSWLHARMRVCDWDGLDEATARLVQGVESGVAVDPFVLLAVGAAPAVLRRCAERYFEYKCGAITAPGATPPPAHHGRIRIGYFSADFHDHATMVLMAEVFERHDRSRFEVIAFSFGPPKRDAMHERARAAFERFIDVGAQGDAEVAALARQLELDVAVDLKGFTEHSRPGIFAHRAAPVQVSYLGYPGTIGARCIDYLLADAVVVADDALDQYVEKIAWLPDTYQANASWRPPEGVVPDREQNGLPAQGFVFCCFNNSFKITPGAFEVWMRLLRRVPGSVLWLLECNTAARANLQREAAHCGVAPERLVFAQRASHEEHLRRHTLADLFLDTLHYGAHTTASDALRAGVPVLTCMGATFASRVAASLSLALGLPEMVTTCLEDYEGLAVELANDPARLAEFAARLLRNAAASALFDPGRFTRNLERAYLEMHERQQAGLPPAHLRLPPDAARNQAASAECDLS